ncbi:hypothetical protein ACFWG5_11875 [Streptomyces hydrogenans]|uniref:hypothetical protein n=1 Tax=Streptomyces hydrogenans TaxID=1873719 RepID=UPI00364F1401
MRPSPAAAGVSDLGFVAFTERNRPRYLRYASARLGVDSAVRSAVEATFAFAQAQWHWLLAQPGLSLDVWEELRYQVGCESEHYPPVIRNVARLYDRLPQTSADSVLLCRHLGLDVDEASDLMGVERAAVEAGLVVAHRNLPFLVERGCM